MLYNKFLKFIKKTSIFKLLINNLNNNKFSNDFNIQKIMLSYKADEFGHEANINNSDLGYGWIHYGLIRQIKPKKILCIGSRYGFIPAVLAQACFDNGFGKVDFVDAGYGSESSNSNKKAWTGKGFWKTKQGKESFQKYSFKKHIQLFVLTTKQYAKKYKKIKYDYIYIDGDHSYQGVKIDYNLFWPRLKIEGFIIFHDIFVKEKLPEGQYGVWKLWDELKSNNKIEFFSSGSGLGIIQKK